MKNKENVFAVLGGGQSIGTSCYYLNIGGDKILLDCGMSRQKNICMTPRLDILLQNGDLRDLSEIDALFISHAHQDHMGYISGFVRDNPEVRVYTTEVTKMIGKHIIEDGKQLSAKESANLDQAFYYMNGVSYGKKIHLKHSDVTLYEAGHIPGAAMVYIESDDANILYTGDFSMRETALTNGLCLPSNLKPDTLIMCGVHAKRPWYVLKNKIDKIIMDTCKMSMLGISVFIRVRQLTKGIEMVNIIDRAMDKGLIDDMPIYYDEHMSGLGDCLSELNMQVFTKRCVKYDQFTEGMGVYIGARPPLGYVSEIQADFSLHCDFEELCGLIERLEPKNLFVVHTVAPSSPKDSCELERRYDNMTVYYPEVGDMYII